MVPLGSLHPLKNLSPYTLSPNHFKPQGAPSSIFHQSHKILKSVTNYAKFSLSSAKEKYMDTYMVMSTTKNQTRTKYSKEVS